MPVRALTTTALLALLSGLGAVAAATPAHADVSAYYLSPSGSDSNDGSSPATAWQTLARAGQQPLVAGQSLLLQGGAIFSGSLLLDTRAAGTDAAPVHVGSFGGGRAVIAPLTGSAVTVYDTGGLEISDLVVRGNADTLGSGGGFNLYNDLPSRLSHVHLSRVEASGFTNGIEAGGRTAGFSDLAVSDSVVHDNRDAGLVTYGPAFDPAAPQYANTGVQVTRVQAYLNRGNPANTVTNSGNGIVLGSVDHGAILSSLAHDNGGLCRAPQGPVGIWTYDAHAMRIAGNTSSYNRTGNAVDGDGFDLDQNVSNSVMERNTSVGNDGAGYLVYTAANSWAHHDNAVRYNSSRADSRKSAVYGGITVAGRVLRTSVYGNTVDTTASPVRAPALAIWAGVSNLSVSGNTFRAATGRAVVVAPALSRTSARLAGNSFASSAQAITWGRSFPTVAAFRRATGQS